METLFYVTAVIGCAVIGKSIWDLSQRGSSGKADPADYVLTGTMVFLLLGEAAHLAGLLGGMDFTACKRLFLLAAAVLFLAGCAVQGRLLLQRKRISRNPADKVTGKTDQFDRKGVYYLLPLTIALGVMCVVGQGASVYLQGDMTVETVNTILAQNAVTSVNPLTGEAYRLGMPMRLKVLCLPTLYAILADCFSVGTTDFVWRVVPVLTVAFCLLAFWTVAKHFFSGEHDKRALFLCVVLVIFLLGDGFFGMDGFGLLHGGFLGVTIRQAVLVPYTFGLLLRKKRICVLLCILTEMCMVWTLYGFGVCALVTVGMLLTDWLVGWWRRRTAGKEQA